MSKKELSHVGLHSIMERIETPLGRFRIGADQDAHWVQFTLHAPDYAQHDESEWHGRKWRISKYMTEREVVGTAFAAVLASQEHEVREGFKYLGQAIFGPHIPVGALMVAAGEEPDARAAARSSPNQPDHIAAQVYLGKPCGCAHGFCIERLGGMLPADTRCSRHSGAP